MVMTTTEVSVPFVDLGRQHEAIAEDLRGAFDRVVTRGCFTLGEEVEAFESEFAAYMETSDAIGVASGTDALHLSLRALGIGPGDEVITAANTFAATAEAIVHAGATPVFADVDEATGLLDPASFESQITSKTSAVIPVHLWGQCADMEHILAIARRYGLAVIEDACQAHGAVRGGKAAGSMADAGCFSFYPSKNLGALGDGGAVITSRPDVAERVRLLRNHGESPDRLHTETGYCSRLHGLQAALLRAKLPHLERWNAMRGEAATAYDCLLAGSGVVTPHKDANGTHVYHLYVVQVDDRDEVRWKLAQRGVGSAIHYGVPLHLEPAFMSPRQKAGDLPIAEKLAGRILSLPMFPYLSGPEVTAVAQTLREVAADA